MINIKDKKNWFVYMILASDDSIYTGITTDIEKRFNAHLNKKGAKYFYGRKPIKVIYKETCYNRSEASKREYLIKEMTKKRKLDFIYSAKKKS